MKAPWILLLLLAGCGHGAPAALAPDAQLAHADGLLSGYAGQVAVHDGTLGLALVHQALLAKPLSFDAVEVPGLARSRVLLGQDHNLYVLDPQAGYHVVGSYAGTPVPGQPLRFQWVPGARLSFLAAGPSTQLALQPLPPRAAEAPALVKP